MDVDVNGKVSGLPTEAGQSATAAAGEQPPGNLVAVGGGDRVAWHGDGVARPGGSLWRVDDSLELGGGSSDLDLDLLASSLRADDGDVAVLLRALVTRLAGALGDRLRVERAGGRFRKSDQIQRLSIQLGDDLLEATVTRGGLESTVSRSSGGIRIRSTKVSIDEWLVRLLTALRDEAATSQATRAALESLVIGGSS
jgi:hypothetical protein